MATVKKAKTTVVKTRARKGKAANKKVLNTISLLPISDYELKTIMHFADKKGFTLEDFGVANPNKIKVGYLTEGNFTKCVIALDKNLLKFGISKRNNVDAFDPNKGEKLAFYRAIASPSVSLV